MSVEEKEIAEAAVRWKIKEWEFDPDLDGAEGFIEKLCQHGAAVALAVVEKDSSIWFHKDGFNVCVEEITVFNQPYENLNTWFSVIENDELESILGWLKAWVKEAELELASREETDERNN